MENWRRSYQENVALHNQPFLHFNPSEALFIIYKGDPFQFRGGHSLLVIPGVMELVLFVWNLP
ncbi:hypothetical protein ACS0TY_022414 [Phlomoides rotata]